MQEKEIQIDPTILKSYIDLVGYKKDNVLDELREVTQKLGDISIMQIGAVQGALIEMLCKVGKFKKCIEIGVFTGYSSICIAKGLEDDGKLYALDTSMEFTSIAQKYWEKAGVKDKIKLIIGEGNNTLDKFLNDGHSETFDFIFIDADKNNYLDYYEKSIKLIKQGGMIAIDNTIWKGKVLDNEDKTESTKSIKKLNDTIAKDNRIDHCLITMYDGMTLCIKK